MDDEARRQLRAVIDERRETYLGWLEDACRQPSVAAQGCGMTEMAAHCEELLRGIGAETRQIATAGYPVVYGEIGAGERTLSFYDHYDVQPPDPLELWESPPFEPSIREGTFYARGVADNKGNLVARIAAADTYMRAFGELPLRLKFIFEGEEEIGSPNMHAFAEAHAETIAADACIWEAGYCDTRGRPPILARAEGHPLHRIAGPQRDGGSTFQLGGDRAERGLALATGAIRAQG